MKKFFLLLCLILGLGDAVAQTKAITDEGREVLLLNNGTWSYVKDSTEVNLSSSDSLKLNPAKFSKSIGASFLVKSKIFNVGVYMNPTKWTFSGHRDNEKNPEYRFSLKSGEAYVMMVTEQTQVSLEGIRDLALLNAQKASVDIKETAAEYRMVNGLKVLCLKMEGTVKGIKFVYFGYYYSNNNGIVQLLGFSSQQYFKTIQKEIESFLNGLVEF